MSKPVDIVVTPAQFKSLHDWTDACGIGGDNEKWRAGIERILDRALSSDAAYHVVVDWQAR